MHLTQKDAKACDNQISCFGQMIGTDPGMLSIVVVTVMGISTCALCSTVGTSNLEGIAISTRIAYLHLCSLLTRLLFIEAGAGSQVVDT
jgi:hypothetical protein